MAVNSETISATATEFKAKCLDRLKQTGDPQIDHLEVIKRGKVVVPPVSQQEAVQRLHGFLRGSVIVPDEVDLTAPVLDEPLDARRLRRAGLRPDARVLNQ